MHKFNIKSIDKLDNPERRKMMPPEETLLKFGTLDDGNLLDVGCGIGYFTGNPPYSKGKGRGPQ